MITTLNCIDLKNFRDFERLDFSRSRRLEFSTSRQYMIVMLMMLMHYCIAVQTLCNSTANYSRLCVSVILLHYSSYLAIDLYLRQF